MWFTADTHFGHAGALALYRRPFGSVAAMDAAMVARWNEVVRPNDDVWHLGDFALKIRAAEAGALLRSLNGRKHLVTGNNDPPQTCWARRVVQRPGLRRDHGRIAPARPVPLRLPHLEWHGEGRAEPPRPQSWSTETAASANRCRGRLLGFSAHRRHPNPRRGALTLSRTSPHCPGAI